MMRAIGALLAVLVAGGLARADFQFQDWWFDRDQPGQLPSGFALGSSNVGSGRWEVKAGPLSSAPPKVVGHISSGQGGPFSTGLFFGEGGGGEPGAVGGGKGAPERGGQGGGAGF